MKAGEFPFKITICGIPELPDHRAAGVTHVLSILDPEIADPPAFQQFDAHHRLSLRFHDIIEPEPERIAPTRADVEKLLAYGRELGRESAPKLLIHCHAGVSRSTASAALILAQADPSRPADAVLNGISAIRPRAWPNLRILEFGDELLGRKGELVAAASAVYRRVLDREPHFEELMTEGGRAREVLAALRG